MAPIFQAYERARKRHGIGAANILILFTLLVRILQLRFSRVALSQNTHDHILPPGYENQLVNAADLGKPGFEPLDHYADAIIRGDHCVATRHGDKVVGFNLYSDQPTRLYKWLEFYFPQHWLYSYADNTSVDHRGRGLSPARWSTMRAHQQFLGQALPTVSVVDLHNLPAWYRNAAEEEQVIGYLCAAEWGALSWGWRSRGCRSAGCGIQRCAAAETRSQ
jgi:hypothetical protein